MRAMTVILFVAALLPAGASTAAAAPVADAPIFAPAGEEPPSEAPAVAPRILNYQARLTDAAGVPLAGPVKLVFRLYDVAVAGSALWAETHGSVALVDGVASVLLGSLVTFPGTAFSTSTRYLGITVNDGAELAPRLQLASAPFALEAEMLQGKTPTDFEPKGAVIALSINDGTPPNSGQNRVHWNVLTGVPEGFVDGIDTGVSAHGELTGLDADDHPQYALETDLAETEGLGPNTGKNLVHWENLVGVPSGFADGADNTGAGATTAI
jgi:hypothetical protein